MPLLKHEKLVQMIFAFADEYTCRICYSERIDTVIVPCGHVMCWECLQCLQKFECPFCRGELGIV